MIDKIVNWTVLVRMTYLCTTYGDYIDGERSIVGKEDGSSPPIWPGQIRYASRRNQDKDKKNPCVEVELDIKRALDVLGIDTGQQLRLLECFQLVLKFAYLSHVHEDVDEEQDGDYA